MGVSDYISQLREDFNYSSFSEKSVNPDPIVQFRFWFDEMLKSGMLEPTAFVLSTSALNGKPSSRTLLLKSFGEQGFVFFTNYDSRKGRELQENPRASMLFWWDKLARQVRIEGYTEKISPDESDAYFRTRPYKSRLGAWASKQSEVLANRFSLMRDVVKLFAKYPINVPLPPNWGGYRLIPDYFEFWQGRESRLHDRIRYRKEGNNWLIDRLYP